MMHDDDVAFDLFVKLRCSTTANNYKLNGDSCKG
jgi:hypothetical protein